MKTYKVVSSIVKQKGNEGMLKNERGNISAVLILIGLICSSIFYFISTTDNVDKEVRTLGSMQTLSYLRTDIAGTVQSWLEGFPNPDCPSTLKDKLQNEFSKFATPGSHSDSYSGAEIKLDVVGANNATKFLLCYMHPNRYTGFSLKKFNAKFSANGAPNYQSLSQEISARIELELAIGSQRFLQKYNFGFRMRAVTLKDYGIVWTVSGNSAPLLSAASDKAIVNVFAQPLIIKRESSDSFNSNRLLALNGPVNNPTTRPNFFAPIHLNFPVINIDNSARQFFQDNGIEKIFQKGIVPDAIKSFDLPTEHGSAWNEVFNVPARASAGMPLPLTSSRTTTRSGRISNKGDGGEPTAPDLSFGDDYFKTSFQMMPKVPTDSSASIPVESCQVTSGSPGLPIYANSNSAGSGGGDFVIDLSKSKDLNNPPIFCGLISANKIIVKLNNEASTQPYHQHYIIGKFHVTTQFVVEGEGTLNILDISTFEGDDILIDVSADKKPDSNLLRSNFNSFSFLSYRNFILPILKTGKTYGGLPTPAPPGEINWVQPTSIAEWLFSDNLTCPAGQWCYKEPLAPKPEIGGAGGLTVYPRIDNALPHLYFRAELVL
jgi:hypothetical protein